MVNASNTERDLQWMREHSTGFQVEIHDQTDELAGRFDEAQQQVNDLIEQSDLAGFVEGLRSSAEPSGSTLRDGLGSGVGHVFRLRASTGPERRS